MSESDQIQPFSSEIDPPSESVLNDPPSESVLKVPKNDLLSGPLSENPVEKCPKITSIFGDLEIMSPQKDENIRSFDLLSEPVLENEIEKCPKTSEKYEKLDTLSPQLVKNTDDYDLTGTCDLATSVSNTSASPKLAPIKLGFRSVELNLKLNLKPDKPSQNVGTSNILKKITPE